LLTNEAILELMKNPIRTVDGRVLYYAGGGSSYTAIRNNTNLKSFTVERVGEEGKFFGFGICSKLNMKILDKDRTYNFTTADMFRPVYADKSSGSVVQVFTYPKYYVSEVSRDETNNELTITAYDVIHKASQHTVSELTLPNTYTFTGFVSICATFLGANSYKIEGMGSDTVFTTRCEKGTNVNFEGSETIRAALNAIAEATQTIYYLDKLNTLVFKRLDKTGDPVLTIDKSVYFSLDSYPEKTLTAITHSTELGENLTVPPEAEREEGSTQVIRDNPFLDLREDLAEKLESAIAAVSGTTITPFNCSWRGNILLELGDKIAMVAKDGSIITSYVLNDIVEYDGALREKTQWNYDVNTKDVSHSNPTNLGEALKQTFAKVDKANKRIDMVVSEVDANRESVASIALNVDSISNTVRGLEQNTTTSLENINDEITKLYSEVETKMTKDDYTIAIKDVLNENGVDKVITSTGFKFDETGLTVSKTNSEIETTITEDGMRITKDNEEVLTADNVGVKAKNLYATSYLIINQTSRFEDYDNHTRTGCFWIGGA
jgi:hypothetical protein